jgi:hypothetical protein
VDARTHRVNRVITEANSECDDVHIALNSIWLSDNVGDVVSRVPYESLAFGHNRFASPGAVSKSTSAWWGASPLVLILGL